MRNNFSHKFSQIFCHPLSGSGKKNKAGFDDEKWWAGAKKEIIHRSILNLDQLIKSARSQIKPDLRSNDLPGARFSEISKIPDQMTCHMPNLSLKSHQNPHQSNQRLACYLTENIPFGINWLMIIDQIWHLSDICSFLPSPSCSFPPPSLFSSISRDPDPRVKGVCGGDYP